jgi:hypothetical protein
MANEPITREEILLNAVATGEAAILEPITREEMFLAKLGGADVATPTPVTRKEQFLQKAIEGGSGGGTGGGGDESTLTKLIEGTVPVHLVNNQATTVGASAFRECPNLVSVDLPAVTSIGTSAFQKCPSLTTANFPAATSISSSAFQYCNALITLAFPAVTRVEGYAFRQCALLTTLDFHVANNIYDYAFYDSAKFAALILRNQSQVSTLAGTHAFSGTPIESGTGYIYVPRALVDSYKAATNWSTYAAQFRALEDYTVDGTVTGALDPNKI